MRPVASVAVTAVLFACGTEEINPRPVLAPSETPGSDPNAPWPVARHDEGFTGRTSVVGARNGALRWSVDTQAPIGLASPVIGADGTIYVGNLAGALVAFEPTGTVKWRASLPGAIEGAAAVTPDAIYVGANDARVHVLALDGKALAQALAPASVRSSVIVDRAGRAYFATAPFGRACSAMPGADAMCALSTGSPTSCPFAIAADHFYSADAFAAHVLDAGAIPGVLESVTKEGVVITIVYRGTRIEAHTSQGQWLWATDFGNASEGTPAAIATAAVDGSTVYVLRDRTLMLVGPHGIGWAVDTGTTSRGNLAIDGEGAVYFGAEDGNVHAFDRMGKPIFTVPTGGHVRSSPAIGADGTVYVGSDDGRLYAIGP